MALKLEVVMRILKNEDEFELAKLTGLTEWNVRRCKALLSFPRKYLDMTLIEDERGRLKGDFFVELYPALESIKSLPELYKKHSRNNMTDIILDKYQRHVIKAVTELRDLAKLARSVEKGAPKRGIERAVQSIIEEPEVGIRQIFRSNAKIIYDIEKISKTSATLKRALMKMDLSQVERNSSIVRSLEDLRAVIDDILASVKRRR